MLARTRKSGFTLVEILIVVIILGILAAIVIPQFTSASQDARRSNLASQIQTLRSQVELYKLQHNDGVPDLTVAWTPLITCTKTDGTVGVLGVDFGPYMQSTPANPFMQGLAGATTVAAGTAATVPDGSVGFYQEATTGKVWGAAPDPANAGAWILVGD
jgi:general secretion pathway protein G